MSPFIKCRVDKRLDHTCFQLIFRFTLKFPVSSVDRHRWKIIGWLWVTFTTLFCVAGPSRTWNEYKLPALWHTHTISCATELVLFSFGLWSPTLDDAGQRRQKSRFLTQIVRDMKKSNEDEVLNAGEEDQMVSLLLLLFFSFSYSMFLPFVFWMYRHHLPTLNVIVLFKRYVKLHVYNWIL